MLTKARTAIAALARRSGSQAGFTLMEMMTAVAIFAVVLAAIYGIWFGLQRTYAFTEDDMKAQDQARSALAEMVELIRTARQPETAPLELFRSTIVYADATTLILWSDADRDAAHDLELVRFRVDTSGRTLYRDTWNVTGSSFTGGTSTRLVGQWVSNSGSVPLFAYADANSETLASPVLDPMTIRTITISLHVDVYTDQAPIAHELTSVVQPRNLR